MDSINDVWKKLMQNGMSYQDVANADFFHMIELFNEDEKKKKKATKEVVSLAEFIQNVQ